MKHKRTDILVIVQPVLHTGHVSHFESNLSPAFYPRIRQQTSAFEYKRRLKVCVSCPTCCDHTVLSSFLWGKLVKEKRAGLQEDGL